jgi:hypothetical protein
MSKKLRVISINFPFADAEVVQDGLDCDWALFDFDVVVIRSERFNASQLNDFATCQKKLCCTDQFRRTVLALLRTLAGRLG